MHNSPLRTCSCSHRLVFFQSTIYYTVFLNNMPDSLASRTHEGQQGREEEDLDSSVIDSPNFAVVVTWY